MATSLTSQQSHGGRIIGVLIVIAILAIAAWAFLTQPSTVQVSGKAFTVGSGTTPLTVNFHTPNSAAASYAFNFIVTSNPTGGYSYSGSLTNHQTYTITITWRGSIGDSGTCNVGDLTIDTNIFSNQPITHDVSC